VVSTFGHAAGRNQPGSRADSVAGPSAVSVNRHRATAPIFDANTPEHLIGVTNADAIYTFTSRGGRIAVGQG